jgi:pimeloyl-ACP methyl ester carboxylesterase
MNRAVLDGVELEYELHGDGEPVMLVHPGIFADWFTPLLQEAALTSRYRLVHYHRVGCAGSSRVAGPVSLARQAAHGRFLMQHLGIARAHVVGHSSSGNRVLPNAFEQYVADADTFFEQELPALQQWSFRQEDAKRVIQPALGVVGARSLELDPIWGERQQLLLDWLPNVESFVLPHATHLLQVENPRAMAEALAAFFARHPLTVPA